MAERHVGKDKIQLLSQALNDASSSLNLAKQLLSEIERGGGVTETPGLVGKYDGMFMVTEAGKKYPVPDNYSAKTKLIYGDKLKMIEGPEGRRFKLVEEMEREEQEAQLAVKDGRFEALSKDGSYHLIQGAVRYWSGEEGDKIKILLPKGGKNIPFAGLLEIIGREPGAGEPERPAGQRPFGTAPVQPPAEKRPAETPPEPPVEKPAFASSKGGSASGGKASADAEALADRSTDRPAKREEKKVIAAKPVKKEEENPPKKAPTPPASAELSSVGSPAKPLDEEELR
ncbi:MAG: hypothetical protein Q8L46_02520 [candidate division WWE3 bacterium]|nr:hypothetical protein [candidate division WWE3 bacterium]